MFSQPTCIFLTLGTTSICFWILANLHSNVTNIKYDGYQRMLFKSQLNILAQISISFFLSCLPRQCFFCHVLTQFCIITKLTRFKILPFTLAMLLWMMLWVKVNFSCLTVIFQLDRLSHSLATWLSCIITDKYLVSHPFFCNICKGTSMINYKRCLNFYLVSVLS